MKTAIPTLGAFLVDGDKPMDWSDVAITTAAIALPPLAAILTFGHAGAAAFVAALPAHIAGRDRGATVALVAVTLTGLAGVLCLLEPRLALGIGPLLGLLTAAAGRHGVSRPALAALITWCVFTSPILPADPIPVLAIYLVGALASLGITAASGRLGEAGGDSSDEARESRTHVLAFGAVISVGLAVSIWIGGRSFGQHGFWFPLTFLVLLMPPHGRLFSRAAKRTAGTLIGTAVALLCASVSETAWMALLAGALALPLAFRFKPVSYTAFTAFLTVVVLELLTLTTGIGQLAWERIATMGAAALLALVLGLAAAAALRLAAPSVLRALAEE